MKELQLREAKAMLSAVIEAAEQGKPTTITKRGRRAAVVISYEEWSKLKSKVPSFADLLLAVPQLAVGICPRGAPPGLFVKADPIDVRLFARHERDIDPCSTVRGGECSTPPCRPFSNVGARA
jgi:prevent-host-death family protein